MSSIKLTPSFAKIAITIDPETFRALLEVESAGVKTVPLTVTLEGRKFSTNLNPRSFRKAQAAFKAASKPLVSLTGNLRGNKVESACIQVFDKLKREEPA
jgi:hypothetical protein